MMPSCVQPIITASGDVCSRLENEPILSSTYELITLASALVEVTGSRILKPTVQAVYSEDSKKAHRQGWAFLFLGLSSLVVAIALKGKRRFDGGY